jgi:predicted Zn-dependent peptidase
MARLLVALSAPPGDHPDYAPLCMALWVLAGGRASRLHRALVDEEQLCVAIAADATEMVDPGMTVVAAEPVPGADRGLIESRIFQELVDLTESVSPTELERARRLFLSDWVFGLERIEQLGMMAGSAVALFDAGYPNRFLHRMIDVDPQAVAEAARRYLVPDRGGVVAWSVPE